MPAPQPLSGFLNMAPPCYWKWGVGMRAGAEWEET